MKSMPTAQRMRGFTLIELMIVVAIVAIISAIAYPSYRNTILKTNRADAMDTMLDLAGKLERCFTTYGSYNNASCTAAANNMVKTTTKGHYDVKITSTAAGYLLTATQKSTTQQQDTRCTSFLMDQTGKKWATGSDNTNCW